MEEYNYSNHDQRRRENTIPIRSFLSAINPQALAPTSYSSVYDNRTTSSPACHHHHRDGVAFRLESGSSNRFLVSGLALQPVNKSEASDEDVDSLKAKIVAHPLYLNLFEAYMECQKVGAPPLILEQLTARKDEIEKQWHSQASKRVELRDPELDQFMEAYYNMLVKYKEELARPLEEAMEFMQRMESELNTLGYGDATKCSYSGDDDCGGGGDDSSFEDQQEGGAGETLISGTDRQKGGDVELKKHLLKKYGGHLGRLKKELSKNKKKGKLPKEAKQKLFTWWDLHYKWPYPSETEKEALAESTGLDQKQINNWFINQRKRHWKPSEVMQQLTVEDDLHHQNNVALYVNGHHIGLRPYC